MDAWLSLIGLLSIYLTSLCLILFPSYVIKLHAIVIQKFYRAMYGEADERLDAIQLPLSRFLVGDLSQYVIKAPHEPERFSRAIWFIRLLGLIPFVSVTAILLYYYAVLRP